MTNLKDIQFGMNKYCGPAFLSALTGKDTDECAKVLSEVSGKREIKAIEVEYLIKALNRLRFSVVKEKLFAHSLYGNLCQLAKRDGIYMVIVPHHVVGIEVRTGQIYLIDNATQVAIDAAASARLTQRVDFAYKVTPKPEKRFIRSELIVDDRNSYIDIKVREIYEPEEDTTEISLGYIRKRNDSEYHDILTRLWEIGKQ